MLQSLELEAQKVHPGDVQSSQENTCDGDFFLKIDQRNERTKKFDQRNCVFYKLPFSLQIYF